MKLTGPIDEGSIPKLSYSARKKELDQLMTFSLDSQLTFGKYQGQTIQEVIEEDVSYIEWCLDEIQWFNLDEQSMSKYEKFISLRYNEVQDETWLDLWGDRQ